MTKPTLQELKQEVKKRTRFDEMMKRHTMDKQQVIDVLADKKITVRPYGGNFLPLQFGIEVKVNAKEWYEASKDFKKEIIKQELVNMVERGIEISDHNDWDDALEINDYEVEEAQ